jgi:hypothetical protein
MNLKEKMDICITIVGVFVMVMGVTIGLLYQSSSYI